MGKEFQYNPIDHIDVKNKMTVSELMSEYSNAGFAANALSEAVDIYTEMIERQDVTNFLSMAGAMVPAGMRKIVTGLIQDGYVDVLVTTGATLTHDAIEALGHKHHHGSSVQRGRGNESKVREHDEKLRDEGVDRIYDVYLPQEGFAILEDHLRSNVFPNIDEEISIREFTAELGRHTVGE